MRSTTWPDLLDLARWAPSPHNIQPWRLRPLGDRDAELLCASNRLLPETDPTGRFSYVGLGSFVETLAIAARAGGHTLTCSSDPALVDFVLDLNRETLFFDLTDPNARREVGGWLRFSRRSAERSRDGFSPAALGF